MTINNSQQELEATGAVKAPMLPPGECNKMSVSAVFN